MNKRYSIILEKVFPKKTKLELKEKKVITGNTNTIIINPEYNSNIGPY